MFQDTKEVNVIKGKKGFQKVSPVESFWKKTKKTNNCWLWTGSLTVKGYGTIKVNGRNEGAHRYSWIIHFGRIPFGMHILHKCDNTKCVKPSHLFVGTNKENMEDRNRKKRTATGEKCGRSKLSEKNVKDIRKLYKPVRGRYPLGKITKLVIAKKFGVSKGAISSILSNKTWKYV